MNATKPDTNRAPSAIGLIEKPRRNLWLDSPAKSARNPAPSPRTKASPSPGREGMELANQMGLRQMNPPWSFVERVIRDLNPGHGNSHACLSIPGNTYVQCLCGFNGWHLEWRISDQSGGYVHYRACYPGGSKKSFELKKHDFVNAGQHRDILDLEEVVGAFRSFHQDQGLPPGLKWRVLNI